MDAQRTEDVTEWDGRSFSDGFVGLRRLADRGFSGAATDGTGWLFMLNGRVVGTVDAELDDFAEASGTVYQAPEDVLPLLFAMQEDGGTKRAQYYTNDTPLSEADRKLSAGGFTGYVELSENVLSGDYYVTYTGGESRAVAFVGNARRVETGEDAFDLADDEVGIYTVHEVDLDVRDIPDPDTGSPGAGDSSGADAAADDETGTAEPETSASSDGDSPSDEATSTGEGSRSDEESPGDERSPPGDVSGSPDGATAGGEKGPAADADDTAGETSADGPDTETSADDESDVGSGAASGARPDADRIPDAEADADPDPADTGRSRREEGTATRRRTDATTERRAPDEVDDAGRGRPAPDPATVEGASNSSTAADDSVFSEEAEWRETKSIPALDPTEASARRQSRESGSNSGSGAPGTDPEPRSAGTSPSGGSAVSKRRPAEGRQQLQRLESALEEMKTERDELADERDELADERDELASERDELASEVETLEAEVDELESEIDDLRSEIERLRGSGSAGGGEKRLLPPAEARAETNLFIRYQSKGETTLEDAHEGEADAEALRENIRIEHHTSFDDEEVLVEGESFETFLHDTIEYRFTRWIVEELPFEIRDTGNESALRDLYDALPKVDRAEIGGSVSVRIRENGEETREQREFDLVLRDRMGNPLFIAELNDSRDPTPEATLESLVANGGDVAESNDGFAAAFAVTASFFEPGALETASSAVGGGLFGRSKRKSFVKLSRKRGYHLCLVESRDGGFHVTVPDL